MTTTNPNAEEFAAMLAEEKGAIRAGCDALDHTPKRRRLALGASP
jgi:hypothetical protein